MLPFLNGFVLESLSLSTVIPTGPRNRIILFCFIFVMHSKEEISRKVAARITGEAEFDAFFARCVLFYFATQGLCSSSFLFLS